MIDCATDIPTLLVSVGVVIASIPVTKVLYSAYKAIDFRKQAMVARRVEDYETAEGYMDAANQVIELGSLMPPWVFICFSVGIGLQVIASAWVVLAWMID